MGLLPGKKEKVPAPRKAGKKKTYRVNWDLAHDGEVYKDGDEFSTDEKTAAPLLEVGVITDLVEIRAAKIAAAEAAAETAQAAADEAAAAAEE